MDESRSTSAKSIVLDDTDRKLIEQLKVDGRQSFARLGEAVNLTGDSARDRLDRLVRAGIVKVTCSVDPSLLGFNSITLLGVAVGGPAEAIAESLSEIEEFDFIACTAGEFDLLIEAVCADERHLLRTIDSALRSRPDIRGITLFNYLQVLKFTPGGTSIIKQQTSLDVFDLDESDHRLIAEMQRDGRISFQQLAERVGLPYQTARRRAKFLLDNEILRPETITNRLVEGSAVIAGVFLKTVGPVAAISERLTELPEVEIIVHTTGAFDLMLEVACRNREHLAELVGTTLPQIAGIASSQTSIYLRVVKLPQTWSGLVRPN